MGGGRSPRVGDRRYRNKHEALIPLDVYSLELTDGAVWFDGYFQNETILIDDFYGNIQYKGWSHNKR